MTARAETKAALHHAMQDARAVGEQLMAEGRRDRAFGLAVGCDLGTSAAFLFSVDDAAYVDATKCVRAAIAHATREDD